MTATNDALALLPADVRGAFMRINDACIDELPAPRKAVEIIRAELLRLARENAILEIKNRGTLANNLCPDHRDKQTGKPCLACTIETLTRQKERAEAERDALRKAIDEAPTGTVIEAGDDVDGQPRVLIHSTRDELRKGGPIVFKDVAMVVRDEI